MSTFKKFTSNDVIVTPFTVNKKFEYSGTPPGYSETGVSQFRGQNVDVPTNMTLFNTASDVLLYNSVKQLYYTNYISGSGGEVSEAATASFNPDGTISGPFYTTNYINNIQSKDEIRQLNTTGNGYIQILSIPSKQFGKNIKPGSFESLNLKDDGQGNVLLKSDDRKIGNIIYGAGLVLYTGADGLATNPVSFSDPEWESTVTLYETQYKCTIRSNEFNYSMNPSLLTSSIKGQNKILESGSAQYTDFATGSDFSPYVTTVGLYDDDQNLLAVAKLAQPLPTSQTTDTTILINLDR